jgi:hypothetical protein
MPVWLEMLWDFATFCAFIFAYAMYKGQKKMEETLEEYKAALNEAYREIEILKYGKPRKKGPHDFLLEDDPADALLSQIGVGRGWPNE